MSHPKKHFIHYTVLLVTIVLATAARWQRRNNRKPFLLLSTLYDWIYKIDQQQSFIRYINLFLDNFDAAVMITTTVRL